jgi:glutathione S-transferase
MELFYADLSPYARKVRVVIEEKGLAGKVTLIPVNPYEIPDALSSANPLSKVPTLVLDDGRALFDSPLICEYLDASFGGPSLLPARGEARWSVLRRQAIANGILDAAFNIACEINRREANERSEKWVKHWVAAIKRAVDALEAEIEGWPDDVDLAAIATGCALGYLDVRIKDLLDWRKGRPTLAGWYEVFSRRPSMAATKPKI